LFASDLVANEVGSCERQIRSVRSADSAQSRIQLDCPASNCGDVARRDGRARNGEGYSGIVQGAVGDWDFRVAPHVLTLSVDENLPDESLVIDGEN